MKTQIAHPGRVRYLTFTLGIIAAGIALLAADKQEYNAPEMRTNFDGFMPADGFVPDAETASHLARVLLERAIGEASMRMYMPLTVKLDGHVWILQNCAAKPGNLKPERVGGDMMMKIDKNSGAVLAFHRFQ